MRHSAPNSERRDTIETREKLLAAALRVFARDGFDVAGIRAISADAGVNMALVAYHFGGKEGIYREVVARVCDLVGARLHDALASAQEAMNRVEGEAAVEQACLLLDPLMDMVLDEGTSDFSRMLMHEQLSPGPGFQTFHDVLTVPFVELLGGLIARARRTDFGDDERMSALSIMGMLLIFKSAQVSSGLLLSADYWNLSRRSGLRAMLARAVAPTG